MSEAIPEQGGPAPPAAPDAPPIDTASRVARYATLANEANEAMSPEPPAVVADAPTWDGTPEQLEQLREDPAFAAMMDESVEQRVAEMRAELQALGFLEYGPGEMERALDGMERAGRVEQFEQSLQTHDELVGMLDEWYPGLGSRVNADEVIGAAAQAFAAAEQVGYELTGDQAIEMIRAVADEFAALDRGEQTVGKQIAAEAQVFTLLGDERPVVRDLAEQLLPVIARRRGAADPAAATEAVHQATRIVASQPDRPIESSRERVFKFGRAFEEQRKTAAPSEAARRAAIVSQWNATISEGGRR